MDSNLKHIDINLLMDVFGGDEEIICESIEVFSEIANNYYTNIIDAHNLKDWILLGNTSHKAKASCRTMGMVQLGDSFEKIEKNAKGITFKNLMEKKDLNKEEEKLFTSIQRSGCTIGSENIINNEISFIKSSFHEAVDEIKHLKLELSRH